MANQIFVFSFWAAVTQDDPAGFSRHTRVSNHKSGVENSSFSPMFTAPEQTYNIPLKLACR